MDIIVQAAEEFRGDAVTVIVDSVCALWYKYLYSKFKFVIKSNHKSSCRNRKSCLQHYDRLDWFIVER